MDKLYGHKIRILHWSAHQSMTNALAEMDLTPAQGHILGYLSHADKPPCLRDLEEVFHLSHPTVSGLLTRLEKKDFLEFRPDENDRRVKRIYLRPKGTACHETMERVIRENEEKMVSGFSEEERTQFSAFLERAMKNMGFAPCEAFCKEEET